ncbi:hypothetical protein V1507DRAFT_306277 [Lipomyces tetrasporus]
MMASSSCPSTSASYCTTKFTDASYHRSDPACGTCRKKCRKCDRTRPICSRCRAKGLHCEGYPPRFQFCEIVVQAEAPGCNDDETQRTSSLCHRFSPFLGLWERRHQVERQCCRRHHRRLSLLLSLPRRNHWYATPHP